MAAQSFEHTFTILSRWGAGAFIYASLAVGSASAQSLQDMMNQALQNPAVRDAMNGRIPDLSGIPNVQTRPTDMDVREIQTLLNQRGFNAGTPDGIVGAGTLRAIAAFQRSIGRVPTGQLSAEELAILRSVPTAPNTPGSVVAPTPDPREIQSLLSDLGYEPGPVDGAWGNRSQAALNAFRSDQDIGLVGRPTSEDVVLLHAEQNRSSDALAEEVGALDVSPTPRLYALPIVERNSTISVAWENAPVSFSIAMVPLWSDVSQPGLKPGAAPLRLATPNNAGLYHIVMMDEAGSEVLARHVLEVR